MTEPGWLEWLRRASRTFAREDTVRLAFPPRIVARGLVETLRGTPVEGGDDLGARDPEFVRLMVDFFRKVGESYFRWEVRGIEHVPATGPALLVGNHNGGLVITDTFLTFVAVWDRFGPDRVLNGLAHDAAFRDPTMARCAARFGVLRAGHDNAHRAFAAGHLVAVYPGSDLDTFRTWKDRHRIELGGRKGFVKLALKTGVPVVPVVSCGTHEQFVVLSRGERLARTLKLKKYLRAEVLPVTLSLPWGVSLGWLPYIPLPAQTTLAFGEAIRWVDLTPADADDPAVVDRCYDEVRDRMQALMDATSAGRRPIVGARRG